MHTKYVFLNIALGEPVISSVLKCSVVGIIFILLQLLRCVLRQHSKSPYKNKLFVYFSRWGES